MKSREGTIVDADDLIKEMTDTAREVSLELGKLEIIQTRNGKKFSGRSDWEH